LVLSGPSITIPLNDRVILVSFLNRAKFPSWLSEVAQTRDTISGIQFLLGCGRRSEGWPLGTI
jgi:hypothetical protein